MNDRLISSRNNILLYHKDSTGQLLMVSIINYPNIDFRKYSK